MKLRADARKAKGITWTNIAATGLITSSTLSRRWQQLQELARDRHYSSTKSAATHKAAFTKAMNATVR
jgi:hypothetical protein